MVLLVSMVLPLPVLLLLLCLVEGCLCGAHERRLLNDLLESVESVKFIFWCLCQLKCLMLLTNAAPSIVHCMVVLIILMLTAPARPAAQHGYTKESRPTSTFDEPVVVVFGLDLQQIIDMDEQNQVTTTTTPLFLLRLAFLDTLDLSESVSC